MRCWGVGQGGDYRVAKERPVLEAGEKVKLKAVAARIQAG